MKLRQKLTNFLNKEKNNYKENKKLYIVDTSIYMILTLFFFSLPSFSYNSLHLIPVFLMAFLCALIFVRTIIFKKVFIDSIVVSIFGFIFTILISYIVNKLTTPMKMNTTLFFLPLMYLVLYHFFTEEKNIRVGLHLFLVGISLFCFYFFIAYAKEIIHFDINRLGIKFGNPNTIGNYFAIAFAIGLYFSLFEKKYYFFPFLLLYLLLGFTTGSKGFILMVFIILGFNIVLFFGKKKWYISLILILGAILVFFALLQLPIFSVFKQRIYDFFKYLFSKDSHDDFSTASRFYMVLEGLVLFIKRPIIGWGINGFTIRSSFGMYAHNTIIDILANFGLISLIFFLYPLVKAFPKSLNKEKKGDINICILSFYIIIAIGLFTSVEYLSKWYFILLAIINGIYKSQEKERELISLSIQF